MSQPGKCTFGFYGAGERNTYFLNVFSLLIKLLTLTDLVYFHYNQFVVAIHGSEGQNYHAWLVKDLNRGSASSGSMVRGREGLVF